ncbi:MAG: OprO/OprP family phosphate-selective porin [Panacagrimonas sp.]
MGTGGGAAWADTAETRGGVTIRTEDGRFEAKFGGRIHLDGNVPLDDDADNAEEGIAEQRSDFFFRRARLTLEGKAYGWIYKFENDFAGQDDQSGSGFRELWIGTKIFGQNLRMGQAKPYRGMEELTSSNELLIMERPYASSTSLYGNRQYLTGLFLDGAGTQWGWGVSAYSLRNGAENSEETDGVGAALRAYYAPVLSDTRVFHVGATFSSDNPSNEETVSASSARYAGRSGPSGSLSGTATTDEQSTFGLELAGKLGAFYAQGEYAAATFAQELGEDIDADTYYLQLSYLITGETKPYDIKKGVFKSPKPKNAGGAWEAKLRYDVIETEGLATDREISQLVAGLNWYVNPAVRMMFEYLSGEFAPDAGSDSSLDALSARIQFAF